jgi:hypothetical protein
MGKLMVIADSLLQRACCIVLGRGQKIESGEYLAFDGKRSDGNYYTMPHAEPFLLNFDLSVDPVAGL